MYLFSILAYLTLRDEYDVLCNNMIMCFSVIYDNTIKTRVSKLFATLQNYTVNLKNCISLDSDGEMT